MNIKSVAQNIFTPEIRTKNKTKTEGSKDRDPQGQAGQGGQEPPKRELSQEEIDIALENLRALQGVKDNNLQIRLVQKDGITVVFVEDIHGKVVRRIPSLELAQLTKKNDKDKGHILDKKY